MAERVGNRPMMSITEQNDPIYGSYQALTVSNSAVALPSIPAKAKAAHISVETDSIRYTEDTTTPTATVGHLVPAGSDFILNGRNSLKKFRAIRVTSDASCPNLSSFDHQLTGATDKVKPNVCPSRVATIGVERPLFIVLIHHPVSRAADIPCS